MNPLLNNNDGAAGLLLSIEVRADDIIPSEIMDLAIVQLSIINGCLAADDTYQNCTGYIGIAIMLLRHLMQVYGIEGFKPLKIAGRKLKRTMLIGDLEPRQFWFAAFLMMAG